MAFTLFVDESGQDHKNSPYEVLAGIAVQDSRMWSLITDIHEAEQCFFGQRISRDHQSLELKARDLLKTKTFRLAGQMPRIEASERTRLAHEALTLGAEPTKPRLTALGQAKHAFAAHVLELCARHQVKAFASIIPPTAPRPSGKALRKDYAYLFERFFYFLDEQHLDQYGFVVFDELEKTQSRILINQMAEYFQHTATGRRRASRILPEPLFVHSDLTTLIRVADLIAYIISWGVQVARMTKPNRAELAPYGRAVCDLRYRATRERDGQPFWVWSFAMIDDLRPRTERDLCETE